MHFNYSPPTLSLFLWLAFLDSQYNLFSWAKQDIQDREGRSINNYEKLVNLEGS